MKDPHLHLTDAAVIDVIPANLWHVPCRVSDNARSQHAQLELGVRTRRFRVSVLSRLLYTARAHGLASVPPKAEPDARVLFQTFLKLQTLVFSLASSVTLQNVLRSVLLPCAKRTYFLRKRTHDFELLTKSPTLHERNFTIDMLYKDICQF
jgi:hypothetical protein